MCSLIAWQDLCQTITHPARDFLQILGETYLQTGKVLFQRGELHEIDRQAWNAPRHKQSTMAIFVDKLKHVAHVLNEWGATKVLPDKVAKDRILISWRVQIAWRRRDLWMNQTDS